MALRKTAKRGAAKRKMKVRKNRTMRAGIDNKKKSLIVRTFLEMLNTVKLYHWKTHSFAQHKATDDLYERLNGHVDTFIEVLLGKDESRIKMVERRCELLDFSKGSDFKERVYEYREFLVDMNRYFDAKRDTDLLNIRDEILGDINQFLYLMTFH
jgi:DNA-binding ferritin-like protein